MKKIIKRGTNAMQIFIDYERDENRLPTKAEFDLALYGRELRRGESNYYYTVRRKYLAGCEAND